MSRGSYIPSILRDTPECDECRTDMHATKVYHPSLHETVDAWECPNDECDARPVVRDDEGGI